MLLLPGWAVGALTCSAYYCKKALTLPLKHPKAQAIRDLKRGRAA